jgi:hypothetical protein
MTAENVTTDPVPLHYTLTSADLLDGFGAQHRYVHRPGYLRWVGPMLGVAVVGSAVNSALSGDMSTTAVVVMAVMLVVLGGLVVGLNRLVPRLFGGPPLATRLMVRQIMRGNPALSQPIQGTVSDSGLRLRNTTGETTTDWSQYPLHIETDRSFVLLASQRRGAAVLVLPKRGLVEPDPAPLRALLAAHTRRLG